MVTSGLCFFDNELRIIQTSIQKICSQLNVENKKCTSIVSATLTTNSMYGRQQSVVKQQSRSGWTAGLPSINQRLTPSPQGQACQLQSTRGGFIFGGGK